MAVLANSILEDEPCLWVNPPYIEPLTSKTIIAYKGLSSLGLPSLEDFVKIPRNSLSQLA
jgi:hypothetical protein